MSATSGLAALGHDVWQLLLLPQTWFVACVVLISGVVRGFSGFGGALIFIPLTASILGPKKAVAIFYLFDLVSATPYGYTYFPRANWKEVAPMYVGAFLLLPVGVWVLAHSDPLALRWALSLLVIFMLMLLMSGWRYKGQPTAIASFGVGMIAGFSGGSTGISGPVVIAYWLSSLSTAAVVRANIMVFYALQSTTTDIYLFFRGLFTFDVVVYALVAWPLYSIGLAIGARFFKGASDGFYRSSAYALIALSALVSLPLFDRWIR